MSNAKKQCIFCEGNARLTKEHFWPDWIGSHLPKDPNNSYISEVHTSEFKSPQKLTKRDERQGQVHSKRFRVVCSTCNNGWMSQLETKVKPILLTFLNKTYKSFDEEELSNLALWSVVKCIVAEHSESGTALTPRQDRTTIRSDRKIPEYFRVYISRHSSTVKAAYHRHSATMSYSMEGPNPPLPEGINRNISLTSFLIGDLFICVFAARIEGSHIDNLFHSNKLINITDGKPIDYMRLTELNDADISYISGHISRIINQPTVKYGGDLKK